MSIAIIDGDLVAYRCAASCKEDDDLSIACIRADVLIRNILDKTGSYDYWLYLSGSRNFRYTLYPEYKANRRDIPRPKWLQSVREYLVLQWQADMTDGYEADDAIGIKMTELQQLGLSPICCSLDKDLLQIPGKHYNFVKEELIDVNEHNALVNFYSQLLLGDRSDNIPGFDGMARVKPTKEITKWIVHLQAALTEVEMYDIVLDVYNRISIDGRENLKRNAQLLYIWRKENDEWTSPVQI